jgi:hypothetical protein
MLQGKGGERDEKLRLVDCPRNAASTYVVLRTTWCHMDVDGSVSLLTSPYYLRIMFGSLSVYVVVSNQRCTTVPVLRTEVARRKGGMEYYYVSVRRMSGGQTYVFRALDNSILYLHRSTRTPFPSHLSRIQGRSRT